MKRNKANKKKLLKNYYCYYEIHKSSRHNTTEHEKKNLKRKIKQKKTIKAKSNSMMKI